MKRSLDAIFSPETIAVVGASEKLGSVGQSVFANLIQGHFRGQVYPVNPKRKTILGYPAYPRLQELPSRPDLVVVVAPSTSIPQVIRDAVEVGAKGAVIISAGFREIGPAGRALEEEIFTISQGKLRIIGPNCLGIMRPAMGLNATFARAMAKQGSVAFLSQSGALCTGILDWSFQAHVGFSAFISTGSMLDVGWGDLIDYFGDDPHTKSIVMYMESIGDAGSFLSAARSVALKKPIIVIKTGRSDAAAKAAASHTGAMTGSDDVLDA
ncbi:MAG: CoA-binding protein, partial [Deltaproteobacteria bacterium]|nr:CoA-binding protein [Deltaproteobacteria bacterium]